MGLNITWLGTIWGLSVGILVADILYYLTDEIALFVLAIPFAFVGRFLGKRYQRKMESERDPLLKRP